MNRQFGNYTADEQRIIDRVCREGRLLYEGRGVGNRERDERMQTVLDRTNGLYGSYGHCFSSSEEGLGTLVRAGFLADIANRGLETFMAASETVLKQAEERNENLTARTYLLAVSTLRTTMKNSQVA